MKLCHFSSWEPCVIKGLGTSYRTDFKSSASSQLCVGWCLDARYS